MKYCLCNKVESSILIVVGLVLKCSICLIYWQDYLKQLINIKRKATFSETKTYL